MLTAIVLLLCSCALGAEGKPRVAIFPLGGDGAEQLRERAAFSLRTKLDRTGKFDVVDGPRMQEITAEDAAPLSFANKPDDIRERAKVAEAEIALWGEISGGELRMKLLDLRSPDARTSEIIRPAKLATDLRFAVEEVLQEIVGVAAFEHPVEQVVWEDDLSKTLWQGNANLVANGDFSKAGAWTGLYRSEMYSVAVAEANPAPDKVAIVKGMGEGNAMVLNLARECAESNGLAALSDAFAIVPGTRYRLQFRYKSDGPVLHIFVKGYTQYPSPTGKMIGREIYRRQLPVLPATGGQWVTITDDFNPQHIALPVQNLRVDLYAYLQPGLVMFDDVVVKAVGGQTRTGKDKAIKAAATRPASAR